ncbi:hypothetical protein SAMN05444422_1069 [Halobiforma haloterrestris]|uniref:PglZ domain-containing protein n=1 Tax=Natronobacterium haloterrestre TaxID=148448 RepID=A0A1I1HIU4_NATHA|nr:hypothetical protein [Halobiforma haloterrestris]SFC23894.1 hypothetical protein SAMN05444422_1069 [Halobiforma haloterrestris]
MSDELYGADELAALVRRESVLDGAFECLRRIWSQPNALVGENLAAEYKTRSLEHHLDTQEPKLYDELKESMGDHPITRLDSGCGVIMDALSLREGFQLLRELPEDNGWDVTLDWAPIERLPSETKFICREWFDAHSPSAVNRDDYRFVGDLDVPQLPGTDPEFVWTRHPDRRLEESFKGHYSSEEMGDIYEDVKGLLEDIVNESVHNEFLVTSDHGYVNVHDTNPYVLSDSDAEALKNKFSSRFREVEDGYAFDQLREAGVIERVGGYYVVKGYYTPTKRGASKRIKHGGFSLAECMTPVLRINT